MKVCVFADRHPRAKHIARSLCEGVRAVGWDVEMTREEHKEPKGDILAAYGWRNRQMFEAYKESGKHFLYIDLGYWGRKDYDGDYGGYHKVVLDGRHPTDYFQRQRRNDRLGDDAPKIFPWRNSRDREYIVVAGLSGKGAESLGFRPFEWEENIIRKIRSVSLKPIVYRPKPSWTDAKPINGTIFSPKSQSIESVLENACLLVTHYSNAAIDALCAGVPIIAVDGPARVMNSEFEHLEFPYLPNDREQFLADVSYCHWRRREIGDGTMFRQFVEDGLLK